MNLIGNCCISSFWLKQNEFKYSNPFCWNTIDFNSIYELITNFNNINFNNIQIGHTQFSWDKRVNRYYVKIDNKITVGYPHYILDSTKKEITKIRENIYYYKIEDFIREKYFKRLKRMCEEPCFLIEWDCYDFDKKNLDVLLNTDIHFKTYIITNLIDFKNYNNKINNVKIVYDNHIKSQNGGDWFPVNFAKTYNDDIKNFLV